MNVVSEADGLATHVIVGSDLASGHHTSMFDIDERMLSTGVEALTAGLEAIESS